LKHGRLEDAYNKVSTVLLLLLLLFESILNFLPSFLTYLKRWQAIVNPWRWITTDESRVAGWYHSVMTIGPDPKPIRTGATLHTACITKGPQDHLLHTSYLLECMVVRVMMISIEGTSILQPT
jgi:hypothetical protein